MDTEKRLAIALNNACEHLIRLRVRLEYNHNKINKKPTAANRKLINRITATIEEGQAAVTQYIQEKTEKKRKGIRLLKDERL